MGKATSVNNSFTFGELSPRSYGLFSQEKPVWRNGAGIIENFLIWQTGGALFSPGTAFCVETKDSSKKSILRKFRYSIVESYIMEVGGGYIRFVANKGQVVFSGVPVEVTTPYAVADINELQFANKADVMYIAHSKYAPQKLQRLSSTSFILSPVQFIRGPFLDNNIQPTLTITPSSATNATTLTVTIPAWVTAVQNIAGDWVTNGGLSYRCVISNVGGTFSNDLASGYWVQEDFFKAGHVGSLWKIHQGVVAVNTFISGSSVSGTVQPESDGSAGNIGGTTAYSDWAEGAFSTVRGWPSSVTFHDGRLVYGGPGQFIHGSVVEAYDNFDVGSTNDADAYSYELATDVVTSIRWLCSTDVLQIGTSGGTASAQGGGGVGITPTNIQIKFDTDYSVQSLPPETISSYLYYLQATTFQLRQLVFDLYLNKQKSEDMTLLADHILREGGGAVDIDRQQSPNDRLWVVRKDGQMAIFTRNAEQQVMGWARRTAGVTATGAGLFESVCILTQDGDDDIVYVIVNRNINGTIKRYIEYFTPEIFTNYWEPVRLDCSATLDNPVTITGISNASTCVVTAPLHGFSSGDQIKFDGVLGMTEVNTFSVLVANPQTNTFEITDLDGNTVDSTDFNTYLSGGQVRKMVSSLSGLSYLNGEYVSVVCDGGVSPQTQSFLVSGGAITLPTKAAVVHVGLPYKGTLQLLPLGDGSQKGSGQTKPHRIYDCALIVNDSLGGNIGIDDAHMSRIIYPNQTPNLLSGHTPTPYSGVVKKIPITGWTTNSNIMITQDMPLPMMILAVVIDSEESEK